MRRVIYIMKHYLEIHEQWFYIISLNFERKLVMVFLKHFYREKTHYLKGIQLHDITTLAHFKQNRQIYQNGENLYDKIGTNLEGKGGE